MYVIRAAPEGLPIIPGLPGAFCKGADRIVQEAPSARLFTIALFMVSATVRV